MSLLVHILSIMLDHPSQELYTSVGKFDRRRTNAAIKSMYDSWGGSRGDLLKKVMSMFPPVFHRFFLNSFPDPVRWMSARRAYANTCAVWSMVGHVVGLGDRHGENILIDTTTGDVVHVDFSCLFDKGLELDTPEVVPFRLTQNVVDGLGIAGTFALF